MTRYLSSLLIFGIVACAAPALASDEVSVVSHGGTSTVTVLDLADDNGDPEVVDLGQRQVIPTEFGPQIVNDVKVLPDGTHLVAGGDNVGLMVTGSDGSLVFQLSRTSAYGAVAAASVGAYFSGAEPSRILLGSDTVSAAFVRQVSSERLLAFESTRLGEERGEHAEVIVLPGNRLAIAANYPISGVSALDIISVDEMGNAQKTRYSNGENLDHPAETTLDPDFKDLRDIHGFGGDTPDDLLVVTRRAAFRLAPDGTKAWSVNPGTFGLGGEFASGVVLPSGRIALALFQPGEWVEPHANHRIVWLEPDGTPVPAMSGALAKAPKSIDANRGHGGTGTTGFTAGLEFLPLGDPADLELGQPIFVNQATFRLGERINVNTSITYDGPNAVALGRARLVAGPAADAECVDVTIPVVDFARDDSVTILSGEVYPLVGSRSVDSVFDFGAWCAWVQIQDTTGRVSRLGEPARFEIVRQGEDAGGEPIPSTPIGFGGSDAGNDTSDAAGPGGDSVDDHASGGCGCSSADPRGAAGSVLIFLGGMLLARLRRRC